MTRVQTILSNARSALSDPNSERWSNDRLLALLSKGQIHFATKSKLFIAKAIIELQLNNPDYTLPDNAFKLVRITGPEGRIPFISSYDLDKCDPDWQSRTGTKVERIVYDVRSPNKFRIYPMLITDEATPVIDFEFDSVFGVLTGLDSLEVAVLSGLFGVAATAEASGAFVYAQYIQIPERLELDTDTLIVPAVYDDVLENYVLAHAFRDDLDTQNRQLGAEYLQLYMDGVSDATDAHMSDSTEAETTTATVRKYF